MGMSEPIDFKKALELFDGDKELLAELIQDFMQDYPSQLDDIIEAINEGNTENIVSRAHRIKSALTQLAIIQARDLAKQIEEKGQDVELNEIMTLFKSLQTEMEQFKNFVSNFESILSTKYDWAIFLREILAVYSATTALINAATVNPAKPIKGATTIVHQLLSTKYLFPSPLKHNLTYYL